MNLQKLENEHIKIILNLEIGGKMVSLFSKKTDTEYLLGSHSEDPPTPDYGDPFDLRFAYGFDECFPTIKACQLQTGNGSVDLPDHGELWSRSWKYHQKEDSIALSIEGKKLDYSLTKEIALNGSSLNITYYLENKSDATLKYLWSAHPLLSIEENDEILLDSSDKVAFYWSNVEFQDKVVDWPPKIDKAGTMDLSKVQAVDANIAMKLFSAESSVSKAGLYRRTADESLVFSFDNTKLPYLGIWLCYGGWPDNKEERSCTVALEPTNAQTDSLLEAIENGEGSKLKSNMIHQWEIQCSLVSGRAKI
ncbi:hypothetical protein NC796_00225 [Aliifodinibius sp. S!AR15-10]|uniref:hypothetical protein n=1 Tax=Aliifodinibius sp. S!AR15-10 TaxID=2950437 RepID=UPI00285E33EA|nr:hypothetical protein [Aliifodinibius sp. S!AR15-10]MDR8389538.1 hypothetical protein [Aliifodinibius sp. S!AR15-10]